MLNFNSILISSENAKPLAEFYEKVFQKKPEMDDGGYIGFLVGTGFITIGPHDKVKGKNPGPERVLFNLETDDVKGEYERIKNLGAKTVAEPYNPGGVKDMWIATLADPDGNYFQLVTVWDESKKKE